MSQKERSPTISEPVEMELGVVDDKENNDNRKVLDDEHLDKVAVAFSGGGIRSAAFNSGVLKTLYDVDQFNIEYLSTVSGGGYLGSSFMTWLKDKEPEKNHDMTFNKFVSKHVLGEIHREKGDKPISSEIDEDGDYGLLVHMKRRCNYFQRKSIMAGFWSLITGYLENIIFFILWGVVVSRMLIELHGDMMLRSLDIRDQGTAFEPIKDLFLYFVVYSLAAYLGFHFLLLSSTFFLKSIFYRESRTFGEASYKLFSSPAYGFINRVIFAYYSAFLTYWVVICFVFLWGRFHLETDNLSDDFAWMATLIASPGLIGVGKMLIEQFSGIVAGALLLTSLTLISFIATIAAVARVVLWELTDDLCLPRDNEFSRLFQTSNSTNVGVCNNSFSLFEVDTSSDGWLASDLVEVILVFIVLTIFTVYNQKASYLHSYYQFNLVDAFFRRHHDLNLDEMPSKPAYIINTTANNYLNIQRNHVKIAHKPLTGKPYNYVFMKGYQGFNPHTRSDAYLMKYREKETLSSAMTISAAAIGSEVGTYLERYPFLQEIFKLLIIFWKLGLGKWHNLHKSPTWFAVLSRFLVAVGIMWGPIVVALLEYIDDEHYKMSRVTYIVIIVYLVLWGLFGAFLILQSSWPNLFESSSAALTFSEWYCHILAMNPYLRGYMQVTGIRADRMKFVYLSDGGHIENLGVYSLLQLKHKEVLSFDAGADPDVSYGSLFNVLHMARNDDVIIDWKIETKFEDTVPSRDNLAKVKRVRNNVIKISVTYPGDNGGPDIQGTIWYVKMVLTHEETEFINLYSLFDPIFPNEPTANQFFTPLQFEAYHTLGVACASRLMKYRKDPSSLPPSPSNGEVALDMLGGKQQIS